MKDIKKTWVRVFCVIIAMIVGMLIVSVVLCSISGKGMKHNVISSLDTIENEQYKHRIGGIPLFVLDNFTDVIIISNAYCVDHTKPLEAVMRNTTYNIDGSMKSIMPGTRLFANGDKDKITASNYVRYWHGTSYVVRPLLLLTDLSGIRVMGCVLMFLLTAYLALLLFRADRLLSVSFVMAAVVMNLWVVPLSIQYTSVFYIALVSSIIIMRKSGMRHCEFFAAVGCLTAFFDLLTVPLVTLGMPLTVLLATSKSPATGKWKKLLVCSMSWAAGYAVMWVSKWVLAWLIIGYDINDALDSILFRTSTMYAGFNFSIASIMSFVMARSKAAFVAIIVFVIIFLVFNVVLYCRHKKAFLDNTCLLGISLMPFVWCLVLRNHSVIHYWFVWRILFVAAFAYILFLFRVMLNGNDAE